MLALDGLDNLSDKRCMSIKNAPTKWNEITEAAKACGAGDWAMRKWLARCEIPAGWKLKIINHTGGSVTLADMEITMAQSETAA